MASRAVSLISKENGIFQEYERISKHIYWKKLEHSLVVTDKLLRDVLLFIFFKSIVLFSIGYFVISVFNIFILCLILVIPGDF
jgi:hypothetical protein